MNLEAIREFCISLPHVTETVQWEDHLLFKIGGKMFAITCFELRPGGTVLSFKATPDHFFEYQEREGVIPAPYMARNQWLALERWDALRDDEVRDLVALSYRLVLEKLPKRLQTQLLEGKNPPVTKPAKKKSRSRRATKKPARKASAKAKSKRRTKKTN